MQYIQLVNPLLTTNVYQTVWFSCCLPQWLFVFFLSAFVAAWYGVGPSNCGVCDLIGVMSGPMITVFVAS